MDAAASEHESSAKKLRLQAQQEREKQKNVSGQVQADSVKRKPDWLDKRNKELDDLNKSRQLKRS